MAHDSDFLVIGGGIAGAAAAFNLAAHGRVQILEMEDAPGYHTTGRSAALYTETYGNRVVRAITSASRDFLSHPPAGFVDGPVLTPRGTLLAATAETEAVLDQAERDADALGAVTERLHGNALFDRAPYLARTVITSGLFEPAAMDMDVDLLHRGFLRGTARQGGQLTCRAPVHTLTRDDGKWIAATPAGDFRAPVVVNAAGAWADHIAELAGVAAIGLIPKRRSAFTFDAPESLDLEAMPATIAVDESWYVKPEAG
ncbi:MAG: FAD-binding oxidoreductase, partial [Pseudomonadota bacterium]|nr:FAD-binding oxidoreductase [Pseudomonadota bacterium]